MHLITTFALMLFLTACSTSPKYIGPYNPYFIKNETVYIKAHNRHRPSAPLEKEKVLRGQVLPCALTNNPGPISIFS